MRYAALLLLLLAPACGDDDAHVASCLSRVGPAPDGSFAEVRTLADGRLRVTYEDGSTLEVPRWPKRIVSTAPGITETIAYLDGLDRLVGVTEWCNYPEGVRALPQVAVLPLDLEGIVALQPDLIVADRTLHRGSLDALTQRLPGRVLALETSRSLAHYRFSLDVLARVVNGDVVTEKQDALASRLAFEPDRTHAPQPATRVLVVSQWDPLYVEGPGGLMHDMLRACGCVNVACDLGHASGTFSEELVFARKPEVILHREGPPPDRIRKRWGHLPAFQTGRIGSCASDAFSRGGPRIVEALERLSRVLRDGAPMATLAEGK